MRLLPVLAVVVACALPALGAGVGPATTMAPPLRPIPAVACKSKATLDQIKALNTQAKMHADQAADIQTKIDFLKAHRDELGRHANDTSKEVAVVEAEIADWTAKLDAVKAAERGERAKADELNALPPCKV